jgi:PelA/Pel-15E family pectate lyase
MTAIAAMMDKLPEPQLPGKGDGKGEDMRWFFRVSLSVILATASLASVAGESPLAKDVEEALERATRYFVYMVAAHGGYLWWYSEDLKERAGEGKATETQIWVQPPGTPSVGFAFLRAYRITGDEVFLKAAKGAADALVWGQLASGGWQYKIDFDAVGSRQWYFRRDKEKGEPQGKRRNYSIFDDNTTQSALRFLMAMDEATGKKGPYHDAVEYALDFMFRSQFPNGAWPQVYPPPSEGYWNYYTFNDNAMNDCIAVMLDAHRIYKDGRYLESAKKCGDFIVASQLPSPQSGWAQQYDHDMKPAPARWFEPAACCSATTIGNIRTLIKLHLETGEEKYLKPIPAAFDWLNRSKLRENLWARFYELETNRPVYVTSDRKIVYEQVNLRPGYSWFGDYGYGEVARMYESVTALGQEKYIERRNRPLSAEEKHQRIRRLEAHARDVISAQDAKGRWVEDGRIETSTFIRNAGILCDYLEMMKETGRNSRSGKAVPD